MTVSLSSGTEQQAPASRPKLLERFAEFLRQPGLEETLVGLYCICVARYIRFHRLRHPCELGPEQVRRFLEDPKNSAEERAEAAS